MEYTTIAITTVKRMVTVLKGIHPMEIARIKYKITTVEK